MELHKSMKHILTLMYLFAIGNKTLLMTSSRGETILDEAF